MFCALYSDEDQKSETAIVCSWNNDHDDKLTWIYQKGCLIQKKGCLIQKNGCLIQKKGCLIQKKGCLIRKKAA